MRLEAITVTAANLRGQLHELNKIRDQIRNAQVLARRSQQMRQLFGKMQRHPFQVAQTANQPASNGPCVETSY